MSKRISLIAVVSLEGALLLGSVAHAHPTTSTCSEEWQSTFAIGNSYNNYRQSFMSWNRLKSGGGVEFCPAGPTAPGCQDLNNNQKCDATDTVWPWPGYASSCWYWRRRCGTHYIRMEEDAGHGHTWFEEWNPMPTDPNQVVLRDCNPNDGKGNGFVRINSTYQSPNCQNWTNGNLRNVTPHAAGYHSILWVEHATDHQPVIFDLERLQIFPSTTVEVAIKVGSGPNDWWVTTLAPNQPSSTEPNGYQYYDTTAWGWEVERVVIGSAAGQGGPASIGGIRYSTPSNSGWWSQTNTMNPLRDANTRDGTFANTNFGSSATLEAKATSVTSNRRNVFLMFDLSATKSTVTSAKLRLWGNSQQTAKVHNVYSISALGADFSESGITWNNQPPFLDLIASKSVGTTAGWQEFDVTSAVASLREPGFQSITFGFTSNVSSTDSPSVFNSKEGTNKPELVVISK